MVVVHEPSVEFFLEDGRSVALAGHEGRVKLDGSELDSVELKGDIRMRFGDYSMRTESARYDREHDAIIAPGHVALTGATLDVQGEQLELQLATQRVRLRDNVRVVVRPSATRGADRPA
jgi:lipopolysaccharide assembly outer membrane protein LptD (OstA)